jgi:hypothetical protein
MAAAARPPAGDRFHLTQEHLALMLGIRPSVTVVVGGLQRTGALTYYRGR